MILTMLFISTLLKTVLLLSPSACPKCWNLQNKDAVVAINEALKAIPFSASGWVPGVINPSLHHPRAARRYCFAALAACGAGSGPASRIMVDGWAGHGSAVDPNKTPQLAATFFQRRPILEAYPNSPKSHP